MKFLTSFISVLFSVSLLIGIVLGAITPSPAWAAPQQKCTSLSTVKASPRTMVEMTANTYVFNPTTGEATPTGIQDLPGWSTLVNNGKCRVHRNDFYRVQFTDPCLTARNDGDAATILQASPEGLITAAIRGFMCDSGTEFGTLTDLSPNHSQYDFTLKVKNA